VAPGRPADALGAAVAGAFARATGADPASPSPWPSRYYAESAPKTLLVGSAGAACDTADGRRRQWASLLSAGAAWEVTGWAAQDVAAAAAVDDDGRNSDAPAAAAAAVLVVLTGRTLQPQTGWFAYSLTLLLVEVQRRDEGEEEEEEEGEEPPLREYRIHNDVLTLHAL
jgi:hypothetical protein